MIDIGHSLFTNFVYMLVYLCIYAGHSYIDRQNSELFILYTRPTVMLSAGDLFKVRWRLQFVARPKGR